MEKIFLKTSDGIKLALNHYKTEHKDVLIIVHGWFMTKDSKAFLELSKELTQNYDVITADKIANGYKWTYKSTITSRDGGLAYVGDDEKIVLVESWSEPTCETCATTVIVYKYYRYASLQSAA